MAREVPQGELTDGRELAAAVELVAGWVRSLRSAGTVGAPLRALLSRDVLRAAQDLVRDLPRVEAPFSDSPAGAELRAWFGPGRRMPLDRAPVALLRLPATEAEYLRGRSRQALRTNISRALDAGLRCTPASSAQEVWDCVHRIAAQRGQQPEHVVLRRPRAGLQRDFAIAWDATGEPVALTETIVDGAWAGLAVLVSAHGHPDALSARYLLHAATARGLMERQVQVLVVGGSMLLTEPGVRYFQRRTGFVPVWLRPTPSTSVGRRTPLTEPPTLSLDDLLTAVPALPRG